MLKNYSKSRAAKLKRLKISDIEHPLHIKVYWLNSTSDQTIPRATHKHTFYEVHFILDGNITYEDEANHHFYITKGNGILFAPHTGHSLIASSLDILRFSLTFLIMDKSIEIPTQSFALTDTLVHCIDSILYEAEQKSILTPTLIQNHIFEIVCELMRITDNDILEKTSPEESSEDLVVTKAKQYICDNREQMLTCKDVATHCHFNVQYLSRIFIKYTGTPLLKYIHSQKITYAEELLADSSLSLKEISLQLGFANEYYFNTFFKRGNGVSPGEFRKLLCK